MFKFSLLRVVSLQRDFSCLGTPLAGRLVLVFREKQQQNGSSFDCFLPVDGRVLFGRRTCPHSGQQTIWNTTID